MKTETVSMSTTNPSALLISYLHEEGGDANHPLRPAVIVCPGGGYEILCEREGEPVALRFLAAGMNAFVLKYSLAEQAANYAPAIEAGRAVAYVRRNAEQLHVDPDRIFILGFSAGGHVAGSAGILWECPEVRSAVGAIGEESRPNGMILCYPVVSGEDFGHAGSILRCCGKWDATPEERSRYSLEKHVSSKSSPAFIWHCWDDPAVSVRNSLVLAQALEAKGVSCEMHLFAHGDHGISLGDRDTCGLDTDFPAVMSWADSAVRWIKSF